MKWGEFKKILEVNGYRDMTVHDEGCDEWAGSDRPPQRTAQV